MPERCWALFLFAMLYAHASLASENIKSLNPNTKLVMLSMGNAKYSSEPLRGPDNDAVDMADLFQRLGFTISNKHKSAAPRLKDLQLQEMRKEISRFLSLLNQDTAAVLYYSGHGLEDRGVNYLVPVDAHLEIPEDKYSQLLSLNDLIREVEQKQVRSLVVILDACRNMPEALKTKGFGDSSGLKEIRSLANGTRVVYATSFPHKALPAAPGERNSVFTASLLEAAKQPHPTFSAFLEHAGALTIEKTNRAQWPHMYGALGTPLKMSSSSTAVAANGSKSVSTSSGGSMKSLLGIDVALGDSRSSARDAIPEARWYERDGVIHASFPGRFVFAISGITTVSFLNDRVNRFSFQTKASGGAFDFYSRHNGNWEFETRESQGGPVPYTEVAEKCRPLASMPSVMTREFGLVKREIEPLRMTDLSGQFSSDPSVSKVRGAATSVWANEYEFDGLRVTARGESQGWEVERRKTNAPMATDILFRSCEFQLEFTRAK